MKWEIRRFRVGEVGWRAGSGMGDGEIPEKGNALKALRAVTK
jgi:hypothetical protein